jgi:hypothetical protein
VTDEPPWGVQLEHDFDRLIIRYPRINASPLRLQIVLASVVAIITLSTVLLFTIAADGIIEGLLTGLVTSAFFTAPLAVLLGCLALVRLTHNASGCEVHATARSVKLVRTDPHDEVAIAREDIRSVRRERGRLIIETAAGPVVAFARRSEREQEWTAAMLRTLSSYDAHQPDALKAIPPELKALLSRR